MRGASTAEGDLRVLAIRKLWSTINCPSQIDSLTNMTIRSRIRAID